MKKNIIFIAVMALIMSATGVMNVWAAADDPIPFRILPPEGGDAPNPGGIGNDGGSDGDEPNPKSPVQMPTVVQDGYNLYIISGCAGATLILRDEYETEVYSTIITDETGEITLPSTLSGMYEIRIVRGTQTFVGEIEL